MVWEGKKKITLLGTWLKINAVCFQWIKHIISCNLISLKRIVYLYELLIADDKIRSDKEDLARFSK